MRGGAVHSKTMGGEWSAGLGRLRPTKLIGTGAAYPKHAIRLQRNTWHDVGMWRDAGVGKER